MNFLTTKGKKAIQSKDWEVRPQGFWLTVYPENFEHSDGWVDFLNNAGADPNAIGVSVLCFGINNEFEQ